MNIKEMLPVTDWGGREMKIRLQKLAVMICVFWLGIGAAGCGSNFEGGKTNPHMEHAENRLYEGEKIKPDGIAGNLLEYTVAGDRIYFVTWDNSAMTEQDIAEHNTEKAVRHLYSMKPDGMEVREIDLHDLPSDNIAAIAYGADGNLILRIREDKESAQADEWLIRMDLEGNVLGEQSIKNDLHESYAMYNMTADKEGRVYFCYMEYLYLFNADLTFAKKITPNFLLDGVGHTKDGTIICVGSDSAEKFICTLDFGTGDFGKRYQTGTDEVQISEACPQEDPYDFYYTNSYGAYGYNMEQEKSTWLFDFEMSAMTGDDFYGMKSLGGLRFMAIDWQEEQQFVILSQGDMQEWEEKTVITYGVVSLSMDVDLQTEIAEFNRANDKYRIELKDYSKEEDPQMAFNLDILTGNIPDIIDLKDLPADEYIEKGLLEDLSPYFEKDAEIGTEDLLDSVVEAMKVNDRIYYVAPVFQVYSVMAKKANVGNADGMTFAMMKDILEEKGDDAQPFDAGGEKVYMLFALLGGGYADFIDWESGTCRFDSQDFKDILEICNRKSSETEYALGDGWGMPELLRRDIVLFEGTWINLSQLQLYRGLFDGEIALVGYPCETKDGSFFAFPNRMGISAKSENKEAAWEFIRGFLKKEYPVKRDIMQSASLPVQKDAFELYIRIYTATREFTDEFGTTWGEYCGMQGVDGVEVELGPSSKEDVELLRELIDKTHKTIEYNPAVDEIIEDEVKAYFAGARSVDKTAEEIQDRVSTYVNESR
ncbi:MAG: extracellular solute-binding protein [Clostridium sp.]|nr:extracellular solute-binding protein [Clostridium sp.]